MVMYGCGIFIMVSTIYIVVEMTTGYKALIKRGASHAISFARVRVILQCCNIKLED